MLRIITACLLTVILASSVALASDDPHLDVRTAFANGDYAAAVKLLEPMAAQGDATAQYNLGALYSNGQGVAQDCATAAAWFEKAARQGDARAQFSIGAMYRDGQGVAKDALRAFMWLDVSTSGLTGIDSQRAAKSRDDIARQMTPAEMLNARDMVDNCLQTGVKNCD